MEICKDVVVRWTERIWHVVREVFKTVRKVCKWLLAAQCPL